MIVSAFISLLLLYLQQNFKISFLSHVYLLKELFESIYKKYSL